MRFQFVFGSDNADLFSLYSDIVKWSINQKKQMLKFLSINHIQKFYLSMFIPHIDYNS